MDTPLNLKEKKKPLLQGFFVIHLAMDYRTTLPLSMMGMTLGP